MKIFSFTEANKMIPLVKAIVLDIQKTYFEAQAIREYLKTIQGNFEIESPEKLKILEDIKSKVDDYVEKIDRFVNELEELGCFLTDVNKGIVDFPSVYGEKIILLCWNINEQEVSHWHDIKENYASRKMVDEKFLLMNC